MMEKKLKDSGIPWIGAIPEHWEKGRAKEMFVHEQRPIREEDGVITCFRDGEVTLRTNRRTDGFTEALQECGYQGIRKGDLVIHQMDAFAGSIGVSDSDGKGSPVLICLTPNGEYSNRYYCLLLRIMASQGWIKALYKGIRERSTDFRYDTFSQQYLPVPPLEEQERIAAWLDGKCGEIDELIDVEQQMISELEAYRQAVITEAVAHGLNPNVPTKSTNVVWYPQIPSHWELITVRGLSKGFRKGNGITKDDLASDGDIYCIRYGDLYTKYKHYVTDIVCKTNEAKISPAIKAEYGDIYFTCSGEDIDAIGKSIAFLSNVRCLVGGDLIIMKHHQSPKFLGYSLDSQISQKQKSVGKSKLKVVHTSVKELKNVIIPLPPFSEQQEIADYLDSKCAEIDELINVKLEKVETLKQYRQSLIFEAVTGKTIVEHEAVNN